MPRSWCLVLLVASWPASSGATTAAYPCSEAEQRGEVPPSEDCLAQVRLEAEVAAAAVPCWLEIDPSLPPEERLTLWDECEAQAKVAVCGQGPCY